MKKALIVSGVLAMLLVGCTPKEASLKPEETVQSSSASSVETIVIETQPENSDNVVTYYPSDANEDSMAALEARMQSIYFAFDKFDISEAAAEKMTDNAGLANSEASAYNIKIEGNCDEWGSDEYNFALGLKRAKAARDVLVGSGMNADRISMVSYGESNPVCTEKTQECWAKNRRDDFKLLP